MPAHVTFDNSVQLIGFESAPAEVPAQGGTTSLTLYWRLVRPTDTPLSTFVQVDSLDPAYSPGASYDGAVGHGTYPPNFWALGDIVVDRYALPLNARPRGTDPNAIPLTVRVGMYEASPSGGIRHVPTIPPDASDRGVEIIHWKIRASASAAARAPETEPLARFQNGMELLGAEPRTDGSEATLTLHWLARSVPGQNATVFVQALSPEGQLLGQHDAFPLDGRYPTSLLSAGEELTDTVTLRLKRPLSDEDRLILGMYVLPDAEKRIPTTDGRTVVVLPR